MDVKKEDVNICIKSIKEYISLDNFNIHKINIDTNSPYYKIDVLYSNKNDKSQELFLEYVLEKEDNIVLHCFSNNIKINEQDDYKIEKEIYDSQNIIKIFYYKNRWITISNINSVDEHIKNTFNNTNDFYEILNKNLYYTYILKNGKIIFLNKGIKNSVNQKYDERVKNIILDNKRYIFIKINNKEKEYCKYKFKCINPNCNFNHPINYDLNSAYKQYIIEEKNKNSNFKTLNCNNSDEMCPNHKYNKCKFRHQNDPIEEN
jgi:hypothetical protein